MVASVLPFVTIIMPVRNEADFIARSLGAVLAQDYSSDHCEIFVADGMSDDDTRQIIQNIAVTSATPITIVDNPGRIVPTGFNAALAQARGEIIIRVDGHCEIAPDYVSQCVKHLQNTEIAGVGGPIETISQNRVGQTVALVMSSAFGVGGSAFRTIKDKTMFVDTIAFPAYRRAVMDEVGGLDEEFVRNQDDEYNYRLRSLGHKLLLTPDIKSQYYSRSSIGRLWKQYYQYGIYKVRVMQKHPRQMQPRQFVPLTLVVTLLGAVFLAPLHRIFAYLGLLILAAYGTANFAISLLMAKKNGWHHLPLLPTVFATLHFSYGFGFLRGLVKFRKRWREGR